ncbi:PQQ-binding-like beta-propeller repeat protein [Bremerella cremea]|uniref:outer membrane protein assembly factor BamB family protein n=1 Tax=Bremerella cremea TaxID=1031537 RepID=UPI0031EC2EED
MPASFRLGSRFALSCGLLVLVPFSLFAGDWAQWRGPDRDGISDEKGLLAEWPSDGPKLAWQVNDLGDGYGAVSVADGIIFLVVNEGLEDERVKALDATTGQTLWGTRIGKVGNPDQKPDYPAARSTPTVEGEFVYVFGSDGDLACLKAKSGEVVWSKNVRTEYGGEPGIWAYSESPLVDGDKVIVTPGGETAGIVAVDKKTGNTIWKAETPKMGAAGYASVQKATIDGVEQYIAFMGNGVAGVNAKDGAFLWSYEGTSGTANMATPVVSDNVVYSGGGRKGGGAFKLIAKEKELTPEELYFSPKLPSSIGGAVKVDGYLYGCGQSTLMCFDAMTGEIKWQERISAAASIVYADGRLYLHTEDGKVMMVTASPEGFQLLAEFTLPGQPEGRGKEWAYPALADGKLYLRQHGTVWVYDVK